MNEEASAEESAFSTLLSAMLLRKLLAQAGLAAAGRVIFKVKVQVEGNIK